MSKRAKKDRGTSRCTVNKLYRWATTWARCGESESLSTQFDFQVDVLEPRMMLNGDGSDMSEVTQSTMFDLPPEVGQSLVNILQDSGSYTTGPWKTDTPVSFADSTEWANSTSVETAESSAWRDYLIDETAPTGVSTDSALDYIELDGGGFLVFDSGRDKRPHH